MALYLLSDFLVNVFSSSNEEILLRDVEYFFFDSHECDKSGIPETTAALLMNFSNLH